MIIQQQAHTAHGETSQHSSQIYIMLFALWVVYIEETILRVPHRERPVSYQSRSFNPILAGSL